MGSPLAVLDCLSTCREHLLLDGAVTKICGATGPRATLACVLLLVYEPAAEMSKSCNIQRAEVKKY